MKLLLPPSQDGARKCYYFWGSFIVVFHLILQIILLFIQLHLLQNKNTYYQILMLTVFSFTETYYINGINVLYKIIYVSCWSVIFCSVKKRVWISGYYSGIFYSCQFIKSFRSLHSFWEEEDLSRESIQTLQNDTIVILWLFSFRIIQPKCSGIL